MPEILLWACEVSSEEFRRIQYALGLKSILYSVSPLSLSSPNIYKWERLCSVVSGEPVCDVLRHCSQGLLQGAHPSPVWLISGSQTSGCPSKCLPAAPREALGSVPRCAVPCQRGEQEVQWQQPPRVSQSALTAQVAPRFADTLGLCFACIESLPAWASWWVGGMEGSPWKRNGFGLCFLWWNCLIMTRMFFKRK